MTKRNRTVLVAYLSALGAVAVGLVVLASTGGRLGVAAGSGLVILAAAPTAARLRRDPLDAPGIYAAVSMVMFGVTSLDWLLTPFKPPPIIGRDAVSSALLLVAGGLVAFGLGARVLGRAQSRPLLVIRPQAVPRAGILIGLLTVSGLVSAGAVAAGIIGFGSTTALGSGSGAVSQPLFQLVNFGSIVVLAAALAHFGAKRRTLLLAGLTAGQVLVGFLAGFKGLSLTPILFVMLACITCGGNIPWRAIGVTAVVTVGLLLPANAIYRLLREHRAGAVAEVSATPALLAREVKTYALFRFRLIDQVALIHSLTPSPYPYANGSHYEYLPAFVLVPRAIWPDKPIANEGLEFSHTYWQIGPYLSTDTPLTQVGDLYRNFGYVGVGIGLFIWGLLISGFGVWARRWRSARTEAVYLFSLVTWVAYVESDLPDLISTSSKSMLVAILGAWLLLPGKHQEPGYRWLTRRVGRAYRRSHVAGPPTPRFARTASAPTKPCCQAASISTQAGCPLVD